MKLPNDLIKATDYSKVKDREIHEFEYKNGKYIHHCVLGGEHELTPQEVVDCLNGLATIDCDLQTAYAYIKGQEDKIADLEAKLAESEKYNEMLLEEKSGYIDLVSGYSKKCKNYEQQLAEKEKAFNWLHEKYAKYVIKAEKEIDDLQDKLHHYYEETLNSGTCGLCEHLRGEYKTDFAIEQLKQTKKLIEEKYTYDVEESDWAVIYELDIDKIFDQQIKELKEKKYSV